MGTVLDTTVFIELERATRGLPAARAMPEVSQRLEAQLGGGEEVGIAAITASELLHGVHRATEEHRGRRAAFVEAVLAAFPTLSFDLLVARACTAVGRLGFLGNRSRSPRPARSRDRRVGWLEGRDHQHPSLRPDPRVGHDAPADDLKPGAAL